MLTPRHRLPFFFHSLQPPKPHPPPNKCNHTPRYDPWQDLFELPPRPRLQDKQSRLATSFFSPSSRRGYATRILKSSSTSELQDLKPSESIFSSPESAWDHVFKDIQDMPPLLPATSRSGPFRSGASPGTGSSESRTRRQTMTQREISAFDEMFNMIFNAVSEQKSSADSSPNDPLRNIGIGKNQVGDLFGKLRRHSRKMKWTTESDEILDRKKEEMDLCDTDQELLEWAMREVFEESQRYTEVANEAIAQAKTQSSKGKGLELPVLQPPTYPHLIALLMRSFRVKYDDPHLALAIFDHARRLSTPSYVFGCSTQAYNELIETRWLCFRDLTGVYDALEEMIVNGVESDNRTLKLVETMRREVGERNSWEEEDELGSGEVWKILTKIEALIKKPASRSNLTKPATEGGPRQKKWDEWKTKSEDDGNDDWAFGEWKSDQRPEKNNIRRLRY